MACACSSSSRGSAANLVAFDAVREWLNLKGTKMAISKGTLPDLDNEKALANFRNAMDKGVLKVSRHAEVSI